MSKSNTEIERKFFIREMPNLTGKSPVSYERHYLYKGNGVEIRVQRKGNEFEFERKVETSQLARENQNFEITQGEFDYFKALSTHEIIRESYLISESPEITLKIYHGKFEGLVRAEVEFLNEDEARNFKPLDWFGKKITDSPVGRDGRLIELSEKEFSELIKK